MPSLNRKKAGLGALALTAAGAVAMATPAMASGSVTVGLTAIVSGPIAELGQTGLQGVQLAVDDLNAKGGVLGKQVKLVTADTNLSPATGATNVRDFILKDHAVAIFGPVSSAVAVAEEGVAAKYKTPIFFSTSNDLALATKNYTKYMFQVVPNTEMEPAAVARYLADAVGKKHITIATITPDYSFGRDTVASFLKSLKADGVDFTVKAQETPKVGASQYTTYIAALIAAHPDYTFIGQFGGDLVTLTKQAEGFGFFKQTIPMAMYGRAQLKALKGKVTPGAIAWDRAPFWAMKGPGMENFSNEYHAKYHEWPSAWAVMGYTAVEAWAQGAKTAGSFNGDKVSAALSGATVDTIRGPIHLRACDHQGDVGEYVGRISAKVDAKYGFQTYSQSGEVAAKDIILPCKVTTAMQPKS
jgi:branched-chain amino acid transport system substrate-binding protein